MLAYTADFGIIYYKLHIVEGMLIYVTEFKFLNETVAE